MRYAGFVDPDHVPASVPVGLHLTRVARVVSRAFDEALVEAGGSLPIWLVLVNLKIDPRANQRELAQAVGVREPTLTQHLNAMERDGLVARRRDPANRRIHIVELTEAGTTLFLALRQAALSFDARLRRGLPRGDLEQLSLVLNRLAHNAGGDEEAPWAAPTASARPTKRSRRQHPDPGSLEIPPP